MGLICEPGFISVTAASEKEQFSSYTPTDATMMLVFCLNPKRREAVSGYRGSEDSEQDIDECNATAREQNDSNAHSKPFIYQSGFKSVNVGKDGDGREP
jgi:hypothetical protein